MHPMHFPFLSLSFCSLEALQSRKIVQGRVDRPVFQSLSVMQTLELVCIYPRREALTAKRREEGREMEVNT